MAETSTVKVEKQSPLTSTTNWAALLAFAAPIVGFLTKGKVNLDDGTINGIVGFVDSATAFFIMMRRTFFTNTVSTTAVGK